MPDIIQTVTEDQILKEMTIPTPEVDTKDLLLKLQDLKVQTETLLVGKKLELNKVPQDEKLLKLITAMEGNLKRLSDEIALIENKAAADFLSAAKEALKNIPIKPTNEGVSIINITEIDDNKKEEKKMEVKEASNDTGKADAKYVVPASITIPQGNPPPATAGDSTKPLGMAAEIVPEVKTKEEPAVAPIEAPVAPTGEAKAPGLLPAKVKPSPKVAMPKDSEATPDTSNVPDIKLKANDKAAPEAAPDTTNVPDIKPTATSDGTPPAPAPKDVPVGFPSGKAPSKEETPTPVPEAAKCAKCAKAPCACESIPKVEAPIVPAPTIDAETGVQADKEEYSPALTVTGRVESMFSSIRKAHDGLPSSIPFPKEHNIPVVTKETNIPVVSARKVIKAPGMFNEAWQPGDNAADIGSLHLSIAERAKVALEKMGGDRNTGKALSYKAMKEILDRYVGELQT